MYARGELILPLEEAHESDDITSDRKQEFQQANILKKVGDDACISSQPTDLILVLLNRWLSFLP